MPRLAFVNKMDRIGADFFGCVDMMKARLGCHPVAIQIPIGMEENFMGLIDLVEMNAYIWEENSGKKRGCRLFDMRNSRGLYGFRLEIP